MATESGGDENAGPGNPGDETGDKMAATAGDKRDGGDRWGNVCGRRSVYNRRPPSLFGEHCEILRWRMEENVEEMVGTTREVADGDRLRRMATESGGNETARRPGTRPAVQVVPGTRPATRLRRQLVTNEMAATNGIMYTDEGELEFDEDEMAALQGSV